MPEKTLTKDSEFIVGEEKVLNYILAFLFFALFLYGLIDLLRHISKGIDYQNLIFFIALLPAIIFFRKGRSNRVYIRINKTGIYEGRHLITGWANLFNAYITQKETVVSIQDNFLLVIEYRKEGVKNGLRRRIPLTNTQNKSEEEVLKAVKFFWKEYRKETGQGMVQ